LDELSAMIAKAEEAADGRRIGSPIRTIGQDLKAERPLLAPLPEDPFETGLVLEPRVDCCGFVRRGAKHPPRRPTTLGAWPRISKITTKSPREADQSSVSAR
jgi:hypothetical protein